MHQPPDWQVFFQRSVFYDILTFFKGEPDMSETLTEEEQDAIRQRLSELKLEHRDLDEIIDVLVQDGSIEQLKIKRLKKRKLQLKDLITRLENKLIPDILA